MPKKCLILMSDTGGGHRASAEAIAEALDHLYGDEFAIHIVDAWKNHSPWPLNRIADSYSWFVSDGLWLWNALWQTDDKTWSPRVLSHVITPLVRRSVARLLYAEAPDLIVSVHPLMNHVAVRILRHVLRTDVPFVTVVTDMVTAHPSWFCPRADYCLVPTEAARQRALRYGMPANRVEVAGQPVGLKFAAGVGDKETLKRQLGLDLDRPAVLVVGGGEGMGPVYQIARSIATAVTNAQLVVIAGRNAALQQKLKATAWEIPTHVFGFVNNMPDLMGASDVLVTKAGPGTISEAFIAGLPVVISGFIPGQEEGNVRYVVEHQAGVYAPDPARIAAQLCDWLQPGNETLQQMARNASALAHPEAALHIARRLQLQAQRPVYRPISPRLGRVWLPSPTRLRGPRQGRQT
jgi:1,2-diacylglycerol 3-beta-galactosyltransferase